MKKIQNKGISFVEIIVIISIISLICAFAIPNLSQFHKQQTLNNAVEDTVSLINEARNNTISSKNSNTYGIHFESSKVTLFAGSSYNISSANEEIDFDSSVAIPSTGGINLNGGGSDVVFDRISGDTSKYGTIIIQLVSDTTKQKIISISKIGIISTN